jgi:hypothetical protein
MDELELLRTLRPDVPDYPAEAKEATRAALVAAGSRPRERERQRRLERRRSIGLRWGLAATAAGLAVAVAVTAAVRQTGTREGTGLVPRPGHGSNGTIVNAAQVLSLAAETVEARPASHPRPDQWAYVKQLSYSTVSSGRPGSGPRGSAASEIWIRFDGNREASRGDNPMGRNPHRLYVGPLDHDADETTPIEDYAALTRLPTDPDKLVKKLCPHPPPNGDITNCVFPSVAELLRNVALPPRLQATFYRALAHLPHLVVERDVVDLAGRHDIAVSYTQDFTTREVLLDPHTYQYRGERYAWAVDANGRAIMGYTLAPRVRASLAATGTRHDYNATARLSSGIVDRAGQRP